MKDEKKYLKDGRECTVKEKLSKGYLVTTSYGVSDEQGGHMVFWDEESLPFWVERVFDTPPMKKLHAEYKVLLSRIETAKKDIEAAKKEHRKVIEASKDAQSAHNAMFAKFEKVRQLKYLMPAIEGKITHYAVLDPYHCNVLPFGESQLDPTDRFSLRKARILSLYGDADGDLEWRLGKYRSGMYDSVQVELCTSLDEAVETLRNWMDSYLSEQAVSAKTGELFYCNHLTEDMIKCAGTYRIAIPRVHMDRFYNDKISFIKKKLEKAEKQRQSDEKILADYERLISSPSNNPDHD